MIKKYVAAIQFIAIVIILFTANWPEVKQILSSIFPYGEIVIPAGIFVMLFQILVYVYSNYLWRRLPGSLWLGGQWIYKTNRAKKTENGVDLSEFAYGIFEVVHTIDKIYIKNGRAWDFRDPPDFDKCEAIWNADIVVLLVDKKKLVIVGNIISGGRERKNQYVEVDIVSDKKMEGVVWGILDPNGEYAYGYTTFIKISDSPREDAAKVAYQTFVQGHA